MGGWESEGNIDADPLFVDPGNGDSHLVINSSCNGPISIPYENGDLYLAVDSSCIDPGILAGVSGQSCSSR